MAKYATRHFHAKGQADGARSPFNLPSHLESLPEFAATWYMLGHLEARLNRMMDRLNKKRSPAR